MSKQSVFPKTIYVVQHVAFEDLGSLEDLFYQLGYRVRYFEAGVDALEPAFLHAGLTIILGGPIGVYETEEYPFLQIEIYLLKQRLASDLPTIGICLGAQMIAYALNAKVYAGPQKEIGWSTLLLNETEDNPLAPLANTPVLHWHGDTFDLPAGATLLASSTLYKNQAFSLGKNILALQFHLEVAGDSFEPWLVGHTCELKQAKLSINQLRADHEQYADELEQQCALVLQNFLNGLEQTVNK